ncbi:MAG: single-stranded-DNA-specific exonuclease RecJ [Sulfurimonas sp.]
MFKNIETITQQKLETILQKRLLANDKKLLDIPPPHLLKDATKSAKRLARAIKDGEPIALIGDYDVDGVSATAIAINFFKQISYPLEAIIPNRFSDGYGVSASVLKRVDAKLIITVDNGISAIEAGEVCASRGIDLIITDHHTPPQTLPKAYAIVDPKQDDCSYPISEICGAEVIWLVLAELKKELKLDVDMREFLGILAIATIADIMPLVDINRAIVKAGLKQLLSSNAPYATIIRDFLNKKTISSEDIAFMIAPRLNSAGRMSDASIALRFFTASTIGEAYEAFSELGELNELRKTEEALITKEAIAQADGDAKVIVVAKDGWHEGIVGIVASKLVEHFSKPAIVLSINGDEAKGSARSLGRVDIHKLLEQNAHLLSRFGGHTMAAGLALKCSDIDAFKSAINKTASLLDESDFLPYIDVLGILPTKEIDLNILNILERFEPYGEANQRPRFYIDSATVLRVELFGKEKNHSRVVVKQNSYEDELELLFFKQILTYKQDSKISCSYTIVKNEFNSRVSTQLIINKIHNTNTNIL